MFYDETSLEQEGESAVIAITPNAKAFIVQNGGSVTVSGPTVARLC